MPVLRNAPSVSARLPVRMPTTIGSTRDERVAFSIRLKVVNVRSQDVKPRTASGMDGTAWPVIVAT